MLILTRKGDWQILVGILLIIVSGSSIADPALDEAQKFIECSIFYEVLSRNGSLPDSMLQTLEDTGRGALIAANVTLANGGYRADYIEVATASWLETRISFYNVYVMAGDEDEWLLETDKLCDADLNKRQAILVNQWRSEIGK